MRPSDSRGPIVLDEMLPARRRTALPVDRGQMVRVATRLRVLVFGSSAA